LTIFQTWLSSPKLTDTEKAELRNLSPSELNQSLTFGTAGLRVKMGIGPHRLNRFTIRQTSEAFYRFLEVKYPSLSTQGIVIAYDTRQHSRLFAEETASIFAYHHVPVYLYNNIRPTPMLSFAVRNLNAVGGVMITASHNPPTDNGYKVYGPDGAQLLPADATFIEQEMKQLTTDILNLTTLSYGTAVLTGLIRDVPVTIDEAYHTQVLALTPPNAKYQTLSVVYTPLHGTGQVVLPKLFATQNFINLHLVKEQMNTDTNFSTITSPNPEEEAAFHLGLKLAKQIDADLVIATDPDADRVGIMVRDQDMYTHLSGNEIGILLLNFLLTETTKRGTVYSTIVSTGLVKKIATEKGILSKQTLTGFKYIAKAIEETNDFLFGFEESNGYLIGDFVRDKDAIQTSIFLCYIASYYQTHGKTLVQVLADIYQQYGVHQSKVISLPVTEETNLIDELLLATSASDIVVHREDFRTGLGGLPVAEVGKIHFANGNWIAVRPSGTEPKVKIYMEAVGKTTVEVKEKLERLSEWILQLTEDRGKP
jgi:phosphoglucomutase